jgi:predicted DNA-binding protein (UPF0278 family)
LLLTEQLQVIITNDLWINKVDHKKAELVMQVIQDMTSKFDKYLVAEKAKLNGSTESITLKEIHWVHLATSVKSDVSIITNLFNTGKETGNYEPFIKLIYSFRDNYEKIYFPGMKDSLDKIDKLLRETYKTQIKA